MFVWIGAVAEEEPLAGIEQRDEHKIKSDGTSGVRGTGTPIAPTDESIADAPVPVPATNSSDVEASTTAPPAADTAPTAAPVGSSPTSAPVDDPPTSNPETSPPTSNLTTGAPTSAPIDEIQKTAPVGESSTRGSTEGICAALCNERRHTRTELYGGDILDRAALLDVANQEKAKLISKLHKDYGKETFENIYVDKEASTGTEERYKVYEPLSEESKSTEILKRKFLIKILTVQVALAKKDAEATGCDCLSGEEPPPGSTPNKPTTDDEDPLNLTPVRYVWATGGHSAAAGHGNMYNESYTAYMERDLKPLFGALGIEYEGRNYAMGGTSSGYEVSMCYEQIFGNDVDFMSWDFGMTDGKWDIRLLHYGYRGGLNPGQPAIMALHTTKGKVAQMRSLEELGMAAFVGRTLSDAHSDEIPLSSGISDAKIEAMPEYVRNLSCGEKKLESGDPYCQRDKYSKHACPVRSKQVGWHPGYKVHALDGHSLSLFMIQNMLDALKDLIDTDEKDPEILLATLKKEDENIHRRFVSADLPDYIENFYVTKEGERDPHIDKSIFFQGPSFCRTSRLPSKSRYLGYMTNNGKTGDVAPYQNETYETGIPEGEAKATASASNEEMRLAYATNPKERDPQCTDYVLKPDYRDFYFSHTDDGLTKLVFPNEAEKRAYGYNSSKLKGVLVMFLALCEWGKCDGKEMRESSVGPVKDDDEKSGQVDMFVNGEKVKYLASLGGHASVLVGKKGPYWDADSNGDYEIGVRVKRPDSFIRISAFVVY